MKTTLQSSALANLPGRSFRHYLQAELARRCGSNPRYSLRAFALDLQIDHATLSQILRGTRRLTDRLIERLGTRLGLPTVMLAAFSARERIAPASTDPPTTLVELSKLADYAAAVVAEWHHYAILELTRLEGFQPDVGWIARMLDLSPDDVNIALHRLLCLNLLRMEDAHTWVDTSDCLLMRVRDFRRQLPPHPQERAHRPCGVAPGDQPAEHSSSTFAVGANCVPQIVERIQALRREICELIQRDGHPDQLYRLDIELFPLIAAPEPKERNHGTTCDPLADGDPSAR